MLTPHYQDENVTVYAGDCLEVLKQLPECSVDSVCTDPPYGLEFMGKDWDAPWKSGNGFRRAHNDADTGRNNVFGRQSRRAPEYFAGTAFQEWATQWASECLRVLKPGGHLLAFGGTRTWHRLACAIEDAGFEIRDSIAWLYGSGFPKSLDVSKAIDKAARGVPQGGADPTSPNHGKYRTTTTEGKRWDGDSGRGYGAGGSRFLVDGAASGSGTGRAESGAAETACEAARQWQGWGTALKPAHEPIVVARKPLAGTVAQNVLEHGVGGLNIDACRVSGEGLKSSDYDDTRRSAPKFSGILNGGKEGAYRGRTGEVPAGRWPTNVVLDEEMATELDKQTGVSQSRIGKPRGAAAGDGWGMTKTGAEYDDQGGASRFFPVFRYEAKADSAERPSVNGVQHPTVKPLELMRWLVRLVTPPGGVVLDPFAGSGTTAEACIHEHKRCIAIEREADYLPLIVSRLTKPMEIGLDFGEGE